MPSFWDMLQAYPAQSPNTPLWPKPEQPPIQDDMMHAATQAGMQPSALYRAYSALKDTLAPPYQEARQAIDAAGGRPSAVGRLAGSVEDMVVPTTPLDYAAYAAGGPFGMGAKAAMLGLGAALQPSEAWAGPAGKVGKALAGEKPLLGAYPTTTPARIVNQTADKGGYSVNLQSGILPTEGLMVGKYKNTDPRNLVVPRDEFGRPHVVQHAETNRAALDAPNNYFGTWWNKPENQVYLDVAQRFEPDQIRKATKAGERTGQLAGFNAATKEEFPIGNWKQFVQGPEFASRMHEMAGVGREYLKQFPAKEWWDMHGTGFERVYGSERLPQVAGLTAATAPSSKPIENLQTMSEYMRRYIKGEPTVQPDWRVPEGTMSRNAGSQIGMEAGRKGNLNKAVQGQLDKLQKDKVREEAAAMMGDRDAVVLDRHWARIGEAPERGVYTNTQEGVIKGNDYGTMKNAVTAQARAVGRDPRDFSADVWTGIRKTIQDTNQLYGTKFKGSAITGESKSYADHFEDLIRRKAEHLKISVPEMESRLRAGDAELLSVMLGTPAIYSIYQKMQGGGATSQDQL